MTAIDFCNNDDYYRAQSLFVGKVKQLATKYQVAVLLIAHPRKEGANSKGLTNDSVSGSVDITNRVDVVMTFEKATNAERTQQKPVSGFVNITKNRLTGRLTNEQTKIPTYYSGSSRRMSCNDVEASMVYGCFADSRKEESDMAFEFGDGGEFF
jgi:RecA-family ATPase